MYLNTTDGECYDCMANCDLCYDGETCDTCAAGYLYTYYDTTDANFNSTFSDVAYYQCEFLSCNAS